MTKDIRDITASFETHHNRAQTAGAKMALAVSQAALIIAVLEQSTPEYAEIRVNILDGMQDLAEVIDGLTGDLRDFTGYHIEVVGEIQKALSKLQNSV